MEQYEAYQPPKKKGFYLDPRTKVLFMAFITTLMFFVYENLAMDAAVAIIPLTLLLINRQVRTALIYGGLFALAVVAKLTQGMYVLPSVLNMISVLLVAMVIRLFPIFMLGYYIIESTSTDEFVAAMEKWHVPEAFIIPITVGSAIASDKEVLVFDEPTSGLDYHHMIEVARNLIALSKMGKTLFIITHDPELIAQCCNYFMFIEHGKIKWSGGWTDDNRHRLNDFFSVKL